jgi:hypothetical protein
MATKKAKFVPKAPPLMKVAAPKPKTPGRAPVKTATPSETVREMVAGGELPTQADKDRAAKKAREKARSKVLELPYTPEQELIINSTKLPESATVMRYHGKSGWTCCLMWKVYNTVKDHEDEVVALHMILTDDSGGLVREKLRPSEINYFAPILGGYPLAAAITAFRVHADTNGSTREVRELLGLPGDSPVKMETVIVRDESGVRLGEKQVPKPPKGGNSNKPSPNADLDTLYKRAAKLLDTVEKDLRQKYGHLNNGLQAMNLRNRLKAKGHNV